MLKNVPMYAYNYKMIVARWVDNNWWFWGAYNELNSALAAASEIDGGDLLVG